MTRRHAPLNSATFHFTLDSAQVHSASRFLYPLQVIRESVKPPSCKAPVRDGRINTDNLVKPLHHAFVSVGFYVVLGFAGAYELFQWSRWCKSRKNT